MAGKKKLKQSFFLTRCCINHNAHIYWTSYHIIRRQQQINSINGSNSKNKKFTYQINLGAYMLLGQRSTVSSALRYFLYVFFDYSVWHLLSLTYSVIDCLINVIRVFIIRLSLFLYIYEIIESSSNHIVQSLTDVNVWRDINLKKWACKELLWHVVGIN